jgi:hypothetical protein
MGQATARLLRRERRRHMLRVRPGPVVEPAGAFMSPAFTRPALVLAVSVLLASVSPALATPPGRSARRIQREAEAAYEAQDWPLVIELLEELGEKGNGSAWRFALAVCEQAPPESGVARALTSVAAHMTARSVAGDVRDAARESPSLDCRLALLTYLADQQEWPPLLELVGDRDQRLALLAIERLAAARVPEAVAPLIEAMAAREPERDERWNYLCGLLGDLLGQDLSAAAEYRSLWLLLQEQGGLPDPDTEQAPDAERGDDASRSRFFGAELAHTRVVFVLDLSTSMQEVDAPLTETRTGEPGETEGQDRLQRAKQELLQLLRSLPER